jgi:UDP-N-acetylmuramoyl-L-alanyl-D-glutamate--2,6-diaminopimelate ligase
MERSELPESSTGVDGADLSVSRSLASLASAVGVSAGCNWDKVAISGITQDSRAVKPGYVFVAIRGFVTDGHRFIRDAIARGACAVVAQQDVLCSVPTILVSDSRRALAVLSSTFLGNPTRDLFTVGVTGTNGKTTVCHLLGHLLGEEKTKIVSTVKNQGRDLQGITTPESPILQRVAMEAKLAGKKNLIVEASSAGLALHRLDNVDFDIAVFTNLTRDHYDLHSDQESYLKAKLILFENLKKKAIAVVNGDDPVAARFIAAARGKVVTYGTSCEASYSATQIKLSLQSTQFVVIHGNKKVEVRINLPARHNVYNALAAIAVASEGGMSLRQISTTLASAKSVRGRYQFFKATNGATVVVDFAHSPDSLENMLVSLRPYCDRVICVFGCAGESDTGKRPMMGRISAELADITILTTDNPKNEDPQDIIAQIVAGMHTDRGYEVIVDRKQAIRKALKLAGQRDGILIAGKGHEAYQVIGHEFVPYSDIEYLRALGLIDQSIET